MPSLPDRSLGDVNHVSDHNALHVRYGNSVEIRSGTEAQSPLASTVDAGTLYWATDTKKLYRSNGTAWEQLTVGVSDHGALTGLGDDDHPQYATDADLTTHAASNHVTGGDAHDHVGGDGAQVDHGGLAGLADDDHTQYLTTARHNAIDAADHGSGAAANGFVLKADGAGGASWAAAAAGDVVFADNGDTSAVAINSTTDVTVKTATVTGVVAGDTIVAELVGSIFNNSGAASTFVLTPDFDAAFDPEFSLSNVAAHPTSRLPIRVRWQLSVQSTSAADCFVEVFNPTGTPTAAGVYGFQSPATAWDTSTADLTGSVDVALKARSSDAAAGQELLVYSMVVRKVAST